MELQPKDELGRFASPNPEPLADEPLCVRLPESTDKKVRSLPESQRAAWLRRVIVAAAEQELSDD